MEIPHWHFVFASTKCTAKSETRVSYVLSPHPHFHHHRHLSLRLHQCCYWIDSSMAKPLFFCCFLYSHRATNCAVLFERLSMLLLLWDFWIGNAAFTPFSLLLRENASVQQCPTTPITLFSEDFGEIFLMRVLLCLVGMRSLVGRSGWDGRWIMRGKATMVIWRYFRDLLDKI